VGLTENGPDANPVPHGAQDALSVDVLDILYEEDSRGFQIALDRNMAEKPRRQGQPNRHVGECKGALGAVIDPVGCKNLDVKGREKEKAEHTNCGNSRLRFATDSSGGTNGVSSRDGWECPSS
jgi:hypothetical protein